MFVYGHGAVGRIRYIEKISVTSSGMKFSTFWLVAYGPNHLCYACPMQNRGKKKQLSS
jgi:hypothetical protein